jgi:serine protease Do
VTGVNELRNSISMMQPGTTVKLNVFRSGSERQLAVNLGELPGKQERASVDRGDAEGTLDGVSVENLSAQDARQLGLPANSTGVVVTGIDPSSKAADSGLRRGDVIQEVNQRPVHNTSEFAQALRHAGKNPLLLVNRGGNTLFVVA